MKIRKKVVAIALAGAAGMGLVGTAVAPRAKAANLVVCDAAGNAFVGHPTATSISIEVRGFGRCLGGDQRGPYVATFSGKGTAGLLGGNCGLLATGLGIPVDLTMQSVSNPADVKHYKMTWQIPVTLFPRIGAFAVMQGTGVRGAGSMEIAKEACSGKFNQSGGIFDFVLYNNLQLFGG